MSFVYFGIFNLIMAVFITNITKRAAHQEQIERGLNTEIMEGRLKKLIDQMSSGLADERLVRKSGLSDEARIKAKGVVITREIFNAWLYDPAFQKLLDDLGISTGNRLQLFDVLDCDLSGELEADEIMSGLMALRGPP